jgi:hypothetical protein
MNRFKKYIAAFAFSLMVLALPSIASAQWRDRDNDDRNRDNGRYGQNDDDYNRRNGNNDRNNRNNQNDRNIQATIKNLKNSSKQFQKQLDRELDRSRIDGTRREDQLNDLAKRFTRAAKDLDDSYDGRRDYNRSADEARRVLNLGSQLDRAISRGRLARNLSNVWNNVENDLRQLARAYNFSYNNRGYNDDDDYNDNRNNRRKISDYFPF